MSEPKRNLEVQVGGAVPLNTGVYIERRTDAELLRELQRGEYCNVVCPRQMGKTSAILRIRAELRHDGYRTALIDVGGKLGTPANADDWYIDLLWLICSQCHVSCDVGAWWSQRAERTPNQKLLTFFRDELLAQDVTSRFVVFLDEIDRTLELDYADDFFLAIRSLYNDRAAEPDLRRLAFCLVGVFTPNELVKQARTTTYNVGRTFEFQDFDLERDDLTPFACTLSEDTSIGIKLLRRVLNWTGGQPFLTASGCKKVKEAKIDSMSAIDRLMESAFVSRDRTIKNDVDTMHFTTIEGILKQRLRNRLEAADLIAEFFEGT